MNDYNIFDYWDEEIPKNRFDGLSNDEVIEILKQELLKKEEEDKREEERKKKTSVYQSKERQGV